MRTIKDTLLELTGLLGEAENAAPSDELTAFHKAARAGVYRHAEELGLSKEDLAEVDTHLEANFNGTPKDEEPGDGGG